MKFYHTALLFFFIISCNSAQNQDESKNENIINFETIKGITFHEIKRKFENGLSFDSTGFQQEPEWILKFKSNDSVEVYSPALNKFVTFYLHHDHSNYYHFAREWFAVKQLSKDSIILQRLEVKSLRIKNDERSNVFMTFYSDDYINKVLKTNKDLLQKPTRADTLFVKERSHLSNKYPLDSNFLFAARNPVKFHSKNPNIITVEKYSSFDSLNKKKSYDYLYPEYRINIKKAYKKFYYPFRAIVDTNSKITVYDFPVYEEDAKDNLKTVLQGICDVYLSNLLDITSGNTLGIPHSSLITLYVRGDEE